MKVTFNGRYYIIKTALRETLYPAHDLKEVQGEYEIRLAFAERALKDLEAIEQYRKEQS